MKLNDPYQPPQSTLTGGSSGEPRARTWPWKLYFFFNTGLAILGYPSLLSDPSVGLVDYLSLALSALSTLGLFGFAFNRAYLVPKFWRVLLVMSVVFALSYYQLTAIDLRMGMGATEYRITNLLAWLLVLPAYYALYAYSRPSDHVWALKSDT